MNCMRNTRARWNPFSIAIMVVGFLIAWPVGLAVLAYILWGDNMRTAFDELRFKWGTSRASDSGNTAFNEHRERELNRLEEERRKLDAMREEFDRFMHELRRAKDKDEFDRFMSKRGKRGDDKRDDSGFGEPAPA